MGYRIIDAVRLLLNTTGPESAASRKSRILQNSGLNQKVKGSYPNLGLGFGDVWGLGFRG